MLAGIGLIVQNGKFLSNFTSSSKAFAMTIMIIFAIFYVVAITICFYAYREFKGMLYDNGMGGPSSAGAMGGFFSGRRNS